MPAFRRFPTIVALAVILAAGCLGGPQSPGPQRTVPPPLYGLDCAISNWDEPCVARASFNDAPSKAEVDIVANPKDPLNVFTASKDLDPLASGCVWAVGQVSHDGGHSWTTSYVGGKKSQRAPGDPLYGWGCITDPIMAFDTGGWLFYGLQAYNAGTDTNEPPNPCMAPVDGGLNSGSSFYLARSKDGGVSWDKIIPLHGGEGNLIFHDFPRMASNPVTGSTFVVWNQFTTVGSPCSPSLPVPTGTGNVLPVLAGTRDRGETPIAPVYLVPSTQEAQGFLASPAPTAPSYGIGGFAASRIGARGTLFVFLSATKDATTDTVYLVSSTDDGQTWTSPRRVFDVNPIEPVPGQSRAHTPNTRFRASTTVELAVDNTDGARKGCLYAAWIGNQTADWDVYASRSCDAGQTWTPPVRVNHDVGDAYQMMNRVTVDAAGIVHIAYMTQAYDPGRKLVDLEYAFSENGGDNWTTERVSQFSSNGDLGIHQDGGPFFGDYIGIASSGTTVYVGAPSTLTGKAEVSVARLVRNETAPPSVAASSRAP